MVKENNVNKPFTEYVITINYRNKVYTIQRKFKDFCEL